MFIDIFSSSPALAQILCMLLVAAIIGYFLGHLITNKRMSKKLEVYEKKMYKVESRLEEMELIKDKQALLFDSKKELTEKLNEYDSLLSLTTEGESIKKSLNALNFVPYKEFSQTVDAQNKIIEKQKKENTQVFNNYLEKSVNDMEILKESISKKMSQFMDTFDWAHKLQSLGLEVSRQVQSSKAEDNESEGSVDSSSEDQAS